MIIFRRSHAGPSIASIPPAITLAQSATLQVWSFSGGSWSPSTADITGAASGDVIVTDGGWWDATQNTGNPQQIAADSNGTLLAGISPTLPAGPTPSPGWPVGSQILREFSPAAGTHTFTPPNLGGGGDGHFRAFRFSAGAGKTWTQVDSGTGITRSGTAGSVDIVTATTDGALAQIGDLVIACCACDGDPTAFGLTTPTTGYSNLITTITTSDNVTVGAGYKIATVAGAQSASWDITADNAAEILNATILVLRAA